MREGYTHVSSPKTTDTQKQSTCITMNGEKSRLAVLWGRPSVQICLFFTTIPVVWRLLCACAAFDGRSTRLCSDQTTYSPGSASVLVIELLKPFSSPFDNDKCRRTFFFSIHNSIHSSYTNRHYLVCYTTFIHKSV